MRSNPLRWLVLAGAIHITLTLAIFLVGHFQLLPSIVNEHGIVGNNTALPIDAVAYRNLASQLTNELQTNGVSAWLAVKAPLHCRFYSVLFASAGKLLGHNILAVEPLNLFYYLGVLVCVYLLSRELFDRRAALLAAIIAGAWPSFIIQSTQFIRESLSILCLLALLLLLMRLLTRKLSWRVGIVNGIAGAALLTFFWVLRGNMWNVVILMTVITIVLLVWRMIRVTGFLAGNVLTMTLVLITMLLVPPRLESNSLYGTRLPVTPLAIPSSTQPAPPEGVFARAIKQLGARRAAFRSYRARESDLDADVRLTTTGDIVRYIPRAAVIGFFAPFPRMWFERGTFGLAGRLLSGAETFAMYFLYLAAGVCLWRYWRQLPIWLLFLVATLGSVALGLVVVNAGAIYRVRYVFWIMFIIMAAESLAHLTVLRTNFTKS